jgi:redox-sensitive bicupin YhaK (pirin superfamily)
MESQASTRTDVCAVRAEEVDTETSFRASVVADLGAQAYGLLKRSDAMSWTPAIEPACKKHEQISAIAMTIEGRPRDLGGFSVRRVLPSIECKLVGPFIFFDHMGPATFAPGSGIDVRPHPHINLSTVTYLFEGEILHRDSLGSHQVIRPGEINWMTAGRGIVHSERSPAAARGSGARVEGIQLWVALPRADEETEPAFHHHPADSLPELQQAGARIRVLAGNAYGAASPVHTFSPLFYCEVVLPQGAEVALPDEYEERGLYVVEGRLAYDADRAQGGRMLVFSPGARVVVRAESAARLMLVGGDRLDGERNIWWNFVSSSSERIERAKQDWKAGRFPKVPGDDAEFIPLPE